MALPEETERLILELRAELALTQSAVADLAATIARREPDPDLWLAKWGARLLGFALAAVGRTHSSDVSRGIDRMVSWAESYLRPTPRGLVKPPVPANPI